ncbi:MurR/RpiR family transcriptional regulator [Pseudalkalibacillus hwajinpoensis]|uniref:MurR/RpiR family transcriptional regulator n=1 Tax=Guptibacillus hwajinpoensis TaxID=208199 RepID=UPI001CD32371|nr:MurR/RpiR family transcriptional regulator [Pseudalkalibacillus hwajinpoensis]MCA0990595.1 MurR/RpiR family transcriptional regulator [Pseudalkalibacillus hwajinpoensis]
MNQLSINQMIKQHYPSLSTGQKKVAEWLTQNHEEGALLTAFQMGRKVGVSETTVIRFSYALGFKGYSEMQESVRTHWLGKARTKQIGNSSDVQEVTEHTLFNDIVKEETAVLQQLLTQIDKDEIWKVIDRLIKAKSVYIAGFGSSYGAAYWLHYNLKQLREGISLSNSSGFSPEDLCDLTQDSVVFLFSFPRYRREAVDLATWSQQQQIPVISITNRQLSPIGSLSTLTLTTEEKMESGHHSISSVISLLEMILKGIHFKDRDRISLRQQKLEQLYSKQSWFVE